VGRPRGYARRDRSSLTIEIRPAPRDHAALFPEIERSSGKAFLAIPDLAWIAGDIVTAAEDYLPLIAAGTVWEAVDANGTPVGFVMAETVGDNLHIWELAVAVSHQKQGIGRRLMQAAADHARAIGLSAVTLTTFRSVPWNGPFYASLGYAFLESPLPAALQALVEAEAARGLTDRCAMRLAL
jgi:GNAT superfamily N-acetyltransferase